MEKRRGWENAVADWSNRCDTSVIPFVSSYNIAFKLLHLFEWFFFNFYFAVENHECDKDEIVPVSKHRVIKVYKRSGGDW